MKYKALNFLLIISSLIGYLAWGGNNQIYLFNAEVDILYKLFTNPNSVTHPFIIIPMMAQLTLIITLFQKKPSLILTYIGIGGLGLLLGFMLFIGLLSLNFKIVFSTLPFVIIATITMLNCRKQIRINKKY